MHQHTYCSRISKILQEKGTDEWTDALNDDNTHSSAHWATEGNKIELEVIVCSSIIILAHVQTVGKSPGSAA